MLFLLAAVIFFARTFFTVQVSGHSMDETFSNGQRLLATRAFWLVGDVRKNDIVVFRQENSPSLIIKRVYALGGEEVDWLVAPRDWPLRNGPYTVPAGEVYVLGDNPPESEDSRIFGPISPSQIVGKVVVSP